jgi:peptidoglycan/LPS O-acetylase OafA/YrhL
VGVVKRRKRNRLGDIGVTALRASASRIPSLDGLRAISIILVIVGHTWKLSEGLSIFGVHVFFVISGYLITTLLQKEQQRNGRVSIGGFYVRRCFRILPAAYAYILVIALFFPGSRPGLLYAATYTVSYHAITTPLLFQHLWSLSVEEQFYLLWPLAFVLGFRHRAQVAWAAMLTAALFRLMLALSSPSFASSYMHFSFPGTMDSIAAGCLLAIYDPRFRGRLHWMCEPTAIAIAVPICAWALGGLWWGDSSIRGVRVMATFWGVVPLLIALWVFLLVQRKDRILNNLVASAIGVLSYSLYLWQQPFTAAGKGPIAFRLILLAGCATASYFIVERPMLRLGAYLRSRKLVSALSEAQTAGTD